MTGLGARSSSRRRCVVAALLTAGLMVLVSALPSDTDGGRPVQPLGSGADSAGAAAPHAASPAISPGAIHTLTVTASNVTTLQGDTVNFTAAAPSGVALVNYSWEFGDGTSASSTTATVSHTYSSAGRYLVYVQGPTVGGTVYDNLMALLPFSVQSSYNADVGGNLALLDGAVQENSTSNRSAQADIAPGGSVLVADWIDVGPSSPFWQETSPSYGLSTSALPYAILSTPVLTLSGIDAEAVSFSNATPFGSYELSFGETTTSTAGAGGDATTDFVFTIFVATGAGVATGAAPVSPHPGTLDVYLTGANRQLSADPGTAYVTPEFTVDYNVYQTLVAYNGSQAGPDPSDFVPDLATCVPGPDCQRMYGTSLISPNGDWTFVINPNATFYNWTTGAHYPVTPNDVAFSIARACLLTDWPYYEAHGSWVLCQALLPSSSANSSWDHALHSPLNSTPANILASMTVNDSSYCTPLMEDSVHGAGCITFHTALSGSTWPEFLEFVASPYGGSVISCRWAAAEGYGLPGWESGSSCAASPPTSIPTATAWDGPEIIQGFWDDEGLNINASSPLAYHAVGSGPYALTSVSPNGGQFQLTANPYWGGTTCSGGLREGCLPPATVGGTPDYIGTVNVFLNGTTANQTEAVLNGTADIAGFVTPFAPSFVANEFRQGKLQLLDVPTIAEGLAGMEMDVNLTRAQDWTTTPVSFPSDLMTDLNFRQFLIHSFPTPTLQSACITDGIESCFQSGGAIPAYMAPYYPSNISWFFGTPDPNPLDVGGAGWWWNQTASDGQDGKICTTATPCTFPLVDSPSVTGPLSVVQTWATDIRSISQGAIDPVVVSAPWISLISQLFSHNFSSPLYDLGTDSWIPDYFDPSDYAAPFYLTTGIVQYYAPADNVTTLMETPNFDAPCSGPTVDPTITLSCQGSAYSEMENLFAQANNCALPSCNETERALLDNMAERIANGLGLFANTGQLSNVYTAAPWIDTTTISRNPFAASYGIPFYYIAYRGSVPYGYPLVVSPISDPSRTGAPLTGSIRSALSNQPAGTSTTTLEAGEILVLSTTAAGGSGVYRFDWVGLPPGCPITNAPFVVCTLNGSASTTVSVVVTDSIGDVALASGLGLVVVPRAEIREVVLSPSPLVLGHQLTIEVNESGGLAPLTYSYLGLPPGCTTANSSKLVCNPSAAGTYSIVAEVVDRVGITALGSASLMVTTPTSSPATISLTSAEILAAGSAIAGFFIGAAVILVLNRRRRADSKNAPIPDSPPPGPSG